MNWNFKNGSGSKMVDFSFGGDFTIAYSVVEKESIKKALNCFRACGDKWTRTIDSRIFSPMLYQLSYITLFVK